MTEYIPFEPEMVGRDEIIVWCPDELKSELLQVLTGLGCRWNGGRPLGNTIHSGDSYRVKGDKRVVRSPKEWYENEYERRHLCLFVEYGLREGDHPNVVDLI